MAETICIQENENYGLSGLPEFPYTLFILNKDDKYEKLMGCSTLAFAEASKKMILAAMNLDQ